MPPERRSLVRSKQSGNEGNSVRKKEKPRSLCRSVANDEDLKSILTSISDPTLDQYRITVPNASIYYIPELIEDEISCRWYENLLNLPTWYRPTLKVYGKSIVQSRKIAVYTHNPDYEVKYSGTTVKPHTDYPSVISSIQDLVEQRLGVQFTHVMLNRYDSGDVYIGLHADSLENSVIATVSLGVERTFIMRHRTIKGEKGIRKWKLRNGSLFVMQGQTQRFWKHEIPKEPKITGGRISLTFRLVGF